MVTIIANSAIVVVKLKVTDNLLEYRTHKTVLRYVKYTVWHLLEVGGNLRLKLENI